MICPHCGRTAEHTRVGVTEEQRVLLDWIKKYIRDNKGRAPSYEEMRKAMMLKSKSGIHRLIKALIERGHLQQIEHRARAIAVVD